MKKQKMVIGDIDGFLADFEGAFCEAFGSDNRNLYDLRKRYPDVDPALILEWCNDPENYRSLNPIFGGIMLLRELKSRGFEVDLVTARPKSMKNVTTGWLHLYNAPCDALVHKFMDYTKADLLAHSRAWEHYDIQLFIDDSVEELKAMKTVFPNTVCLAWAQPWNEGYYPRAIYDQEKMRVMVNMGNGNWKWIWSKK